MYTDGMVNLISYYKDAPSDNIVLECVASSQVALTTKLRAGVMNK